MHAHALPSVVSWTLARASSANGPNGPNGRQDARASPASGPNGPNGRRDAQRGREEEDEGGGVHVGGGAENEGGDVAEDFEIDIGKAPIALRLY